MTVRLIPFLSILIIACIFSSCTKPDITFGADYLDNNYTNIVMADTATAAISTVYLDSFVTSSTGKAVVGNYNDPYFGAVSAESYFKIAPPAYSDVFNNTTYSYLELILKPNKSYYGDTTLPLQITVNQLASKIEYAENKTALYNVNSLPVLPTPIGTKTVTIRPSVDTVSIRLSDALGKDLLTKLQTKDQAIQTTDQFTEYFNGLRISSGNSAFMMGYSDSVIMRLHYFKGGVTTQEQTADFSLADAGYQFNHITVNRAGTPLSNLSSVNYETPSSSTNNAGYLQSATGSLVKITFPYLRNFLAIKNFVKIERAELIIKPVNGSFNGLYPLPPQLRLSETTQLNQIGTDVSATVNGSTTVQYGDLSIDQLYGENTSYVYDVTSYINTQIGIAAFNKNGLLLSPPTGAFESDLNRVLVGDKNNANGSIKLRIYYITVNPS